MYLVSHLKVRDKDLIILYIYVNLLWKLSLVNVTYMFDSCFFL